MPPRAHPHARPLARHSAQHLDIAFARPPTLRPPYALLGPCQTDLIVVVLLAKLLEHIVLGQALILVEQPLLHVGDVRGRVDLLAVGDGVPVARVALVAVEEEGERGLEEADAGG